MKLHFYEKIDYSNDGKVEPRKSVIVSYFICMRKRVVESWVRGKVGLRGKVATEKCRAEKRPKRKDKSLPFKRSYFIPA